jgi:hypothetical protein
MRAGGDFLPTKDFEKVLPTQANVLGQNAERTHESTGFGIADPELIRELASASSCDPIGQATSPGNRARLQEMM